MRKVELDQPKKRKMMVCMDNFEDLLA